MKAARVYGKDDLRIIEVDKPTIQNDDDVLVKMKRVGICGSDMHLYHGANPLATLPRVMGHEVVGEVEDFADQVSDLQKGDHVVLEPIKYDGTCYACRHGMPNVCDNLIVMGVHEDGGMQEYLVVPRKQCHIIDSSIPWNDAVLTEPYTIAGNATMRADLHAGDTVLIQGAGPIGLTLLRMAKVKGARVMITDMIDSKLEFAKSWGADATVNVKDVDLSHAVSEWTKGEMANVAIDAVCTPKTFASEFELTSNAGRIVVLGFGEETTPISMLPITKHQLTILGSRLQAYQFDPVIKLIEDGDLVNDGLVNHTFKFDDIQAALDFNTQHADQVKKTVLSFD